MARIYFYSRINLSDAGLPPQDLGRILKFWHDNIAVIDAANHLYYIWNLG